MEKFSSPKLSNLSKLLFSIFLCESAGVLGSFFTVSSISNWYATLSKPLLTPPNWVFGPVWTILYLLMGISVFLVWKKISEKSVKFTLIIFSLQLVLNVFWSIIFFGLQNPGWAFLEIIFLWLAILVMVVTFFKVSRLAARLLIPYILWVSFAAYLNYAILILN